MFFFCFFFSSRRRHTRSLRDWSSDVCSSDLRAVDPGHLRDGVFNEGVAAGVLQPLDAVIRLDHPIVERIAMGERSEEHTSELQSRRELVCRLLLEKKKQIQDTTVNRE